MEQNELDAERDRYNALSPDEATAILAKAEGERPALRSCWYCNGAHEHLKDCEVMLCFACGFYYLSGYPAQVVAKRKDNEDVTVEEMDSLNAAWDN